MTGIFPNVGGVVVRDPNTNLPVPAPNVDGVLVPPVAFDMDCDMTALPNDCFVAPENRQINAIISELVNFAAAMDPEGSWECSEFNNLVVAFNNWVAAFSGSQTGELLCGSPEGAGDETGAALLYCDGATIKKMLIDGEDGLLQMVQGFLCDSDIGEPNTNDDYFLYCRNGVFRKTQAITYQLFVGEWAQARAYVTNNMVRKNRKLYSPNAVIPSGTAFTIGTTGATWYEVSATDWSQFDPTQSYVEDTIIEWTDGKTYAANADIPAFTPFVIGTTGQTWRLVDTTKLTLLDHSATRTYLQNELVRVNGLIYRASTPVGPAAFSAAPAGPWYLVGGERNWYQGDWLQAHNSTGWTAGTQYQYLIGEVVQNNDRLWRANDNIPLAAIFTIGTVGATWKEVSGSVTPPYDPGEGYLKDTVIQYTDGKYYAANADIPPGTAFVVGITGQTWRLISFGGGSLTMAAYTGSKSYAAGEIAVIQDNITNNGDAIIRAGAAGAPSGAFDPTKWDFIGERSKYRGRWQAGVAYKTYDVCGWETLLSGVRRMEFFWALGDITIAANVSAPDQNFLWKPMDIERGAWYASRTYWAGDIVRNMGSTWIANANQALGAAFAPDAGITVGWRIDDTLSINSGLGSVTLGGSHLGQYNIFSAVGAKSLTVPTNASSAFAIGTVITGVSVNGQLTVVAAGGVTIRTPRTLLVRNGDYAAFTLTKVAINEWHLAGDLA